MPTSTPVTTYEVVYSSNTFSPRIWLKNGRASIGQLVFLPDGSALPQDTNNLGQVTLHYHLADFQNIIDLLRNEQPMTLYWTGSGGGNENAVRTAVEPVGEGGA